jgi:hypothetical protein
MLNLDSGHQSAIRSVVRASVANTVSYLRPVPYAESTPEFLVACTFGEPDDVAYEAFRTAVAPAPSRAQSQSFVKIITDMILSERRQGRHGVGTTMREVQERLSEDAQLVAVTGIMGLRSRAASAGDQPGILTFSYMGDGQIGGGIISDDGHVLHESLVQPPRTEEERERWGVNFGDRERVDIGGDLGYLYAALTATDEELALLA